MCICRYQWMLGRCIFFRNFPWWKLNKWCWLFKKVERGSSLQFDFISIWFDYFYLHTQNFLLFLEYLFHFPWTCSFYTWNPFFLPPPVNLVFLLSLYPQAKRCSPFFVLVELSTSPWPSREQELSYCNLWHSQYIAQCLALSSYSAE